MNPVIVRMFTQPEGELPTAAAHAAVAAEPPRPSEPAVRNAGKLGTWRLGEQLSERDGTIVFEAWPERAESDRAPYVVKLLRRDAPESARESLRREATAARQVHDAHVVWVAAAQLQEPPPYLVMPRLYGRSLRTLLDDGRPLGTATALWLVRQAAEGLAALHAGGWLHGDVKPENLIVSRRGHVTLVDLGCARRWNSNETESVAYLAGTPAYLAPEALTTRLGIDPRTDLFALGVTLHELLTGTAVAPADSIAEMIERRRAEEAFDPRTLAPTVPREVADLVQSLTAREPLRRPQSARALIDRIARLEIDFFADR